MSDKEIINEEDLENVSGGHMPRKTTWGLAPGESCPNCGATLVEESYDSAKSQGVSKCPNCGRTSTWGKKSYS